MAPTLSQNTQKLYETGAARKLGTVDEALCHRVLQEVKQQHRVGSKALYKGINTPDRGMISLLKWKVLVNIWFNKY